MPEENAEQVQEMHRCCPGHLQQQQTLLHCTLLAHTDKFALGAGYRICAKKESPRMIVSSQPDVLRVYGFP